MIEAFQVQPVLHDERGSVSAKETTCRQPPLIHKKRKEELVELRTRERLASFPLPLSVCEVSVHAAQLSDLSAVDQLIENSVYSSRRLLVLKNQNCSQKVKSRDGAEQSQKCDLTILFTSSSTSLSSFYLTPPYVGAIQANFSVLNWKLEH
eukprot:1177515-Prorocentrum_minimum.AAC.3